MAAIQAGASYASTGATIGSVAGPVGTAIGAVVGGVIGLLSGSGKTPSVGVGYSISGTVGGPTGFSGTVTALDQKGSSWLAKAETEDITTRAARFWHSVTDPAALDAATRYFQSGGAPVAVSNFRVEQSDTQRFDVLLADAVANMLKGKVAEQDAATQRSTQLAAQLAADDAARKAVTDQLLSQLTNTQGAPMAAPDLSQTAQPAGTPVTAPGATSGDPGAAAAAAVMGNSGFGGAASALSAGLSNVTGSPLLLLVIAAGAIWFLGRKG